MPKCFPMILDSFLVSTFQACAWAPLRYQVVYSFCSTLVPARGETLPWQFDEAQEADPMYFACAAANSAEKNSANTTASVSGFLVTKGLLAEIRLPENAIVSISDSSYIWPQAEANAGSELCWKRRTRYSVERRSIV